MNELSKESGMEIKGKQGFLLPMIYSIVEIFLRWLVPVSPFLTILSLKEQMEERGKPKPQQHKNSYSSII